MKLKPGSLEPEPLDNSRLLQMTKSATWDFFTEEYLLVRKQKLLLAHATQTDPEAKGITQGRLQEIDHLLGLKKSTESLDR